MDERVCGSCRNAFFADANQQLCHACEELSFDQVKAYLEENSGAPMSQVVKGTRVSRKTISRWIKEERLLVVAAAVEEEREHLRQLQGALGQLVQGGSGADGAGAGAAALGPEKPAATGPRMYSGKD